MAEGCPQSGKETDVQIQEANRHQVNTTRERPTLRLMLTKPLTRSSTVAKLLLSRVSDNSKDANLAAVSFSARKIYPFIPSSQSGNTDCVCVTVQVSRDRAVDRVPDLL